MARSPARRSPSRHAQENAVDRPSHTSRFRPTSYADGRHREFDHSSRSEYTRSDNRPARDDPYARAHDARQSREVESRRRRESRSPRGLKRYREGDQPGRTRDSRDYDRDRQRDHDRDRDRDLDRDRDRLRDRDGRDYDRDRDRRDMRQSRDARDRSRNRSRDGRTQSRNGYRARDREDPDGPTRSSGRSETHTNTHDRASEGTKPVSSDVQATIEKSELESQNTESQDVEPQEAYDEDAEIERRRRRRAALLAKTAAASPRTPLLDHLSVDSSANTPTQADSPMAEAVFQDATSFAEDMMQKRVQLTELESVGTNAAEYDPTEDRKEEERRQGMRAGAYDQTTQLVDQVEMGQPPQKTGQPTQAVVESSSQEDSEDDMFADDFDVDRYTVKASESQGQEESSVSAGANKNGGLLDDNDKEAYYKLRIGEVLYGRYQVQAALGKGMFSSVVRAVDLNGKTAQDPPNGNADEKPSGKLVAIKIMRDNDALRKTGLTEMAIIQKLNRSDPEDRKHLLRFERQFDHKGHLCIVFENLSMNLRDVLKKFGNHVGINLKATRAYAYQMFVALAHMRRNHIIHADLKPDNILVSENRAVLKICDFGTAIDCSDAASAHMDVMPYLVSRFYRAPEIILGMLPYDYAMDMWSIGCTLYELYTGQILFVGESNNQMLKAIQEIRGRITPKMYKKGQLSGLHFDEKGQFVSVERDPLAGSSATATVRVLPVVKPTRDLRTRLFEANGDADSNNNNNLDSVQQRELSQFADLLEHCLTLNPEKRITPTEALRHAFFTSQLTR